MLNVFKWFVLVLCCDPFVLIVLSMKQAEPRAMVGRSPTS